MPGEITGSITRVNICQLLAPKSLAEATSERFISCSLGNTIKTTIGMLNAMCDKSTEVKPSEKPITVKRIKNAAPIITSGETNKILFKDKKTFLVSACLIL